ncbi:putative transporter C3B8.04c [Psilocybe cubensis]|uniref:Transporter C3B8.04c n=1 Tax=Psilocybe cubensis TaxID=181762 RepID=A0ACB8H1W4_PSICU|nr:putative transporter C3B8.04c [Psilocybe cubensis]KAH9481898.1 putative transporter C3B8.04c [Psilocybe cubensis]
MKFSSSLKFNAVSDWWDEYIAYDALKKYIYQLEKQQSGRDLSLSRDLESNERSALLNEADATETDGMFIPLLDRELRKIVAFYEQQSKELLDDLEDLEKDVILQDEIGLQGGEHYDDYEEYDEDDNDNDSISASRSPDGRRTSTSRPRKLSAAGRLRVPQAGPSGSPEIQRRQSLSSFEDMEDSYLSSRHGKGPKGTVAKLANKLKDSFVSSSSTTDPTIWTARTDYAYDTRLLYKRRITNLYISFTNLKSYVEVNYSGFRKIIKKYDKVTFSELKDRYLHTVVEISEPFTQASKDKINDALNRLLELYTKCVARGDKATARQQLRLHQRENIAWERDTVWRQMIGRERRGEGAADDAAGATLLHEPEKAIVDIPTPVGMFKITKRRILKLLAVAVLVIMLNVQVVDGLEANRCLAILSFCTVLWATEAIPLFVTSMFVPLLLVLLRVIRDADGVQLSPPEATKYVFSIMFSPTIMLLIGGFTISSALSKTNIDRVLITRVLSLAGTRPSTVLLTFMGVSCFASMWISNVAAPTLCFTLIRLAIALAANVGGQSSPISSPQNLIALDAMDPKVDWATWFAVALPVSAVSILLIWWLLLVSYKPARSPDGDGYIEIKVIRPTREPFTWKQYWVTFVCLFTIALWCVAHKIEELVGDMGVIAIIPVVAFFSTGVLKKDDFDNFMWTIVFLAMGGIALGKGVMSSGLLEIMDVIIRDLVDGLSLYKVVLILSPIVLIISTFISHTIASVLLVPIAKTVGKNLPGDQSNLLIFITGLICSTGMGMPVSGFPNQTAATQEDELGDLYLTNVDFLKNGVPASIIATFRNVHTRSRARHRPA